jgi:hypothetical protein
MMRRKNSLNVVEVHAEKIILALTGGFLLWMAWVYLLGSPNRIVIDGQPVRAGKLDDTVLESAKKLQDAIRSGKPTELEKLDFSTQLAKAQRQGILGIGGLKDTLPRVTAFGTTVDIPGMQGDEDSSGIALVTPLRPPQPAVRTGISLAARNPVTVGIDPSKPDRAQSGEAQETHWVSIATYFDEAAQRNEMVQANYAPFRARGYVSGVDVQRQERLSNGSFSEWKDVSSKAMPIVNIPEPDLDASGVLLNKEAIEKMFQVVRERQQTLMQPEFLEVAAGDAWEIPPLPGFEDEDEEAEPNRPVVRAAQPPKPRQPAPPGGGGGSVRGGGGGGDMVESGGAGHAPGLSAAAQKEEARKQAQKALAQARKHVGQRDFAAARSEANRVHSLDVPESTKKQADKLLARIDKMERRINKQTHEPSHAGADVISDGGTVGVRGGPAVAPVAREADLLKHPESELPAVWFHDDSVEPGKTYRYRMRMKLWNRYVGRPRALRNPEDARKAVIVGEWSLPSEEITVTPRSYFFLSGRTAGKSSASFEVWAWRKGDWIKRRYDVDVGESIGRSEAKVKTGQYDRDGKEEQDTVDFSTGAVVLDIREEDVRMRMAGKPGQFTGRKSVVVTYVDHADGQVKERFALFDQSDPIRARLKEEFEL